MDTVTEALAPLALMYDRYAVVANGYGDALLAYAIGDRPGYGDVMKDYPLARFSEAFAVAAGYLLFATVGAAIWSKLGPTLDLYGLRFVYNLTQAMLCAWMSLEAGRRAINAEYTLACNVVDEKEPVMAAIVHVFYMSKILDFADTFFIITRKNYYQLSFLHVYHHWSIFLVYWFNLNTCFDGDVYLTIVLNALVHFVMYTYYFVSMHTKNIWWKKYLTQMQMVQFTLLLIQGGRLMYTGCLAYPPLISKLYVGYLVFMFALFLNFYIKAYTKQQTTKKLQ